MSMFPTDPLAFQQAVLAFAEERASRHAEDSPYREPWEALAYKADRSANAIMRDRARVAGQ